MPTVLIAVPPALRPRLEGTFFWRSDMHRTFAQPGEVFGLARTLGPDLIVVLPDAPADPVRSVIENLRRDAVTRDAVIVVLSEKPEEAAAFERAGASLILPYGFADSELPWHERVEDLLRVRRRRESRVIADFPVEVWLGEPRSGQRMHLQATGLNLSSRGLLLDLPEKVASGTRLDLKFSAGSGLPVVSVIGEVVRTADTAEGRRFAGVHFIVVRKEARLAIRDTLRALRPGGDAEDAG
jgi:hypothetical protein